MVQTLFHITTNTPKQQPPELISVLLIEVEQSRSNTQQHLPEQMLTLHIVLSSIKSNVATKI